MVFRERERNLAKQNRDKERNLEETKRKMDDLETLLEERSKQLFGIIIIIFASFLLLLTFLTDNELQDSEARKREREARRSEEEWKRRVRESEEEKETWTSRAQESATLAEDRATKLKGNNNNQNNHFLLFLSSNSISLLLFYNNTHLCNRDGRQIGREGEVIEG